MLIAGSRCAGSSVCQSIHVSSDTRAFQSSKLCRIGRTRAIPRLLQASHATKQLTVEASPLSSLRLAVAAHEIPHPAKVAYGGEDAFFISEKGSTAFGVADGVGGWAHSGINPADYSKTLMKEAKAHFEMTSQAFDTPASLSRQSPSETSSTSRTQDLPPQKGQQQTSQQLKTPAAASAPSDSTSAASTSTSYSSKTSTEQVGGTSTSQPSSSAECSPQSALAAAHKATRQPGSSTALILQLKDGTNTLTASNLGDSGFAVFRTAKLICQSSPLQHFFDCPFQFAACPDFTEDTDKPEDASLYEVQLQAGDVIVAATDGLWDNLHTEELIPLLPVSEHEVQEAAAQIAEAASKNAFDDSYLSPYTVEAMKQGMDLPWWQKVTGARFKDGKVQLARLQGGKVDDITVVVAYAVSP